MKVLTDFVMEHLEDDTTRLILERGRYPEIDMNLAVNCIESRKKLKGKVAEWYCEPALVFPVKLSAEQCSSSATGRYKAELAEKIADRREWTIADLTGGLGVDSWFFSQKASKVSYNEMQAALCDAARYNFKILGADNIEVINKTISADTISDLSADIVYIDPARRGEGGKKVFLIEDCTPDVLKLKEYIFARCRHILLKLSPMADITMACERLGSTCREVHVVATGGECKELLIWMDREYNDEPGIHAVELHPDVPAGIFSFTSSEEICTRTDMWKHSENADICEAYIFEPGKALMKAGAFNQIAERFGISKLGKSTHYYIVDSREKSLLLKTFGKIYRILECHSLDKRTIRELGTKYPKAEVTSRNIPMDTETLRKKLGITSGDDAHIFGLKSDTAGNLLFITRRA